MGNLAAQPGDEGEHLGGIHLDGLAGHEVLGRHDHLSLDPLEGVAVAAAEHPHHPRGNVPHVARALAHVFVVHTGEHLGELAAGLLHGVLRVAALRGNAVLDPFEKVEVLEHHLVDFEDRGLLFTHRLKRALVQLAQGRHRGLHRGLEPGDLPRPVVCLLF